MLRSTLWWSTCLGLIVLCSAAIVHSLSTQKPIRNVAIVGSGISGLSLAHALENSPNLFAFGDGSPIQVTVYDARSSLNYEAGAGVQINGGMSVLRKINPTVQRAVADASLPLKLIASRTKPWFGDKEYDTLLTLPIDETFRTAGGRVTEELVVDGEVMAYTIMRGALQEALMDTLPSQTLKRINFNKSLVQITGNDNDGITISFEDGSTEGPFDLVVGCDGVNSAVKDYIAKGTIAGGGRKGNQALYSGIRIRYAIQDENVAKPTDDEGATLAQFFGNGAYALAGIYGAGKGRAPIKCAFTIYRDDDYIGPFRKTQKSMRERGLLDENADWSQDNRKGTSELMLEQIEECGVPAGMLRPIIEESSRFFELGVYFHSPFNVNGWSKEVPGSGGRFCTLAGDAAHAMPPFLGQGSNQAIQDSYCIAKKIFEFNKALANNKEDIDFGGVLKKYEMVRWGPTTSISAKASILGYLEASSGFISKFRDMFFFTLGSLGVAKKVYLGAAVPNVEDVPI